MYTKRPLAPNLEHTNPHDASLHRYRLIVQPCCSRGGHAIEHEGRTSVRYASTNNVGRVSYRL